MEFALFKVTTFVLTLYPQAARPTYSLNNTLIVDISDICMHHLCLVITISPLSLN